jgi:hypothetical protein
MHRLRWIVPLVAVLFLASTATASELFMFRRAGCSWCAAWDRDIGPIYAKTDVGRRAPIRFVDLDRPHEVKFTVKSPVRFSPTFVLVDDNREIGRIEGYPGQDFFWGMMDRLLPNPPSEGGHRSSGAPASESAR